MKLKTGILLLLAIAFTALAGYASGEPPTQKGNLLLAQVSPTHYVPVAAHSTYSNGDTTWVKTADEVPDTAAVIKTSKEEVVLDIAKEVGIEVDTSATISDQIKSIKDGVKLYPGKNGTFEQWAIFITFVLGIVLSLYFTISKIIQKIKNK